MQNTITGTVPTTCVKLTKLGTWLCATVGSRLYGWMPCVDGIDLVDNFSNLTYETRMEILTHVCTSVVSSPIDVLVLDDTSISGSLDSTVCDKANLVRDVLADSGGRSPEVECSCCTSCCSDGSERCATNRRQLCDKYARDLERSSRGGGGGGPNHNMQLCQG